MPPLTAEDENAARRVIAADDEVDYDFNAIKHQLAQEIEEKERIDNMRQEFIVNVSHELKTPIALIQGYAEGLTAGVADDPEDRKFYCDTIADEADHMNKPGHAAAQSFTAGAGCRADVRRGY